MPPPCSEPELTCSFGLTAIPQLLNLIMSVEAAARVYDEAVAKLRIGEVIRVRDVSGGLVMSSDPNE